MNDEEKFRLKLRLIVGLCTAKDIQDWAEATILKDIHNEFALNLCFMESTDKISKYFYDINPQLLNIDIDKISLTVFDEYLLKKLPEKINDQYEYHINNLIFLSEYLNDLRDDLQRASLYSHIIIYDDEINYLIQNQASVQTQNTYMQLYDFLRKWIKSTSKMNHFHNE
ncbi:hypothetical protein F7P75_12110 [Acinetobacter gandensis]|nr:hypothetical protein [Acinetobacter gandensis]KAB0624726.1 hypothetical protein F7P75_12110 [Acinetobacter gandensis]